MKYETLRFRSKFVELQDNYDYTVKEKSSQIGNAIFLIYVFLVWTGYQISQISGQMLLTGCEPRYPALEIQMIV